MHIPTWVPDWTSLSSGWDIEDRHNGLKESLAILQWREVGLPRVSRRRSEMMVQGRVLKTVRKRDYEERYFSAFTKLTNFGEKYPISEVPRPGDLICVLPGCPLLAYLRAVDRHFVLVGRSWFAQDKLRLGENAQMIAIQSPENKDYKTLKPEKLRLGEKAQMIAVQSADKKEQKIWQLKSIEDVQSKPEETFRIR